MVVCRVFFKGLEWMSSDQRFNFTLIPEVLNRASKCKSVVNFKEVILSDTISPFMNFWGEHIPMDACFSKIYLLHNLIFIFHNCVMEMKASVVDFQVSITKKKFNL